MVSPVALLLLNLIHIILGTFGVVFLVLVFASVQELAATTRPELTPTRNYLASAVALAAVAWALAIITGPMGGPAVHDDLHYQVRVVAGLSFVSFVLYAVAGGLTASVYSAYPDSLVAGAATLLFVASVLLLAYGCCAVVLGRPAAVIVVVREPVPEGDMIESLNPLVYRP